MRGNINIFISEYSIGQWDWEQKDDTFVIHHGINSDLFKPSDLPREIPLGLDGADERVEIWCRLLESLGQAGIPALGWNYKPMGNFRTPKTIGSDVAGSVCDSPIEWFDVGPTLVELAGGEIDFQQFAKSACPVLEDPSKEHRTEGISEYGGEIMLLNREWKIVLNRDGQPYLLFNVGEDPQEINNLAGLPEMAEVENELRLRILERVASSQVLSGAHFSLGN